MAMVILDNPQINQTENTDSIHDAAFKGDLETIKQLLNKTKYLVYFSLHKDKNIPYHLAAEGGQIHVLKYFLHGHQVPINIKNQAGNSALHLAARNGWTDAVSFLIDEGASITVCNNDGKSVLHYACMSTSVETVKLLIERGIAVHVIDHVLFQPLHIAAEAGNTEVVKFLIENGAEVNARNTSNENSLHLSVKGGHEVTTRKLIEKGCSLHVKTLSGNTPLMVAVTCGHLTIVKLLCEYGSRPNYASRVHGDDSMCIAASKGHIEICEYFLKCSPNLFRENRRVPLWIATVWDRLWQNPQKHILHILKYIIRVTRKTVIHIYLPYLSDRNNNKEEIDINNWKFSIHTAALHGHLDIIKLLVDHDESLIYFPISEYVHIPYHNAAMKGHIHILKYFLHDHHVPINIQNKLGNSALHLAAAAGLTDTVSFLIDEGASIDICNDYGRSVLHLACMSTSVETVKVMIERGISVDIKDADGCQPLHAAAEEGRTEIIKFLIDIGAEVDATDNDGCSVLDYCILNKDLETVKTLIEKGCSLHVENSLGFTPLMMAAGSGNLSIVELLCENGCRPDEVSSVHNKNCMNIATNKGNSKICEYFLKKIPNLNLQ